MFPYGAIEPVEQTLSLELAQRQHAQVLHDLDEASAAEMGLVIDTTGVEVLGAAAPAAPS